MIGETLGQYKILEKIGEGGMGIVYSAEDTKLERSVALKLLPADMASDPDRLARFNREARAIAALSHPNIVTVYSVEQADGVHFLTMELVDGEPLDQLIPPDGLPIERVLDLSIPLADALAEAHERGIIHRDLKPANIMVDRRGQPKVLDFGLAKTAAGSVPVAPGGPEATSIGTEAALHGDLLTQPGTVMGTAPYMSPEQLAGNPVDHRTDIFALGVVLYEICTGRLPFSGENSAELVSSIMRDTPQPVSDLREDVPRHLGRIIGHCLEKSTADRFQSALDVGNELRSLRKEIAPGKRRRGVLWGVMGIAAVVVAMFAAFWLGQRGGTDTQPDGVSATRRGADATASPGTSDLETTSLVVLPFADRSLEGDQEYFTDGLSEELMNALGHIPGLRVVGHTSSFAFKGKDVPLESIGEQLGVANILEGSVRKAGDKIRVSVQLVTAADGFQLWSETYDRTLEDVFAVQDDIARSVAEALQVPLFGRVAESTRSRRVNPEAYNLMLLGRHFADKLGEDDLRRAAEHYEEALELDPDYALAWAGLAETYSQRAARGYVPFEDGYARAREAANRALESDDTLAESWATLGRIRRAYDWDWAGADEAFGRALELEPRNAEVLRGAASLAANLGRPDQAIELTRRAVDLDPLLVSSYHNLGLYSYFAGRLDQAESALEKALELNPGGPVAHSLLGRVYLAWSQPERALEEIESEPHPAFRLFGLALAQHALDEELEAQAALDELVDTWGSQAAYQIAEIHAFRGEIDQAFEWLERAYEERDPGTAEVRVDPLLMGLQDDPRWPGFLRKMRLAN